MVDAISITLAIRLVVFLVVRDKIVHRESIVSSDKVHASIQGPIGCGVYVWTADQPSGKIDDRAVVAFEKAPYVVAIAPVPLGPAMADKGAHLVQSGCIPGFCDELCADEVWIGLNVP